jgi:hypothetical protein
MLFPAESGLYFSGKAHNRTVASRVDLQLNVGKTMEGLGISEVLSLAGANALTNIEKSVNKISPGFEPRTL